MQQTGSEELEKQARRWRRRRAQQRTKALPPRKVAFVDALPQLRIVSAMEWCASERLFAGKPVALALLPRRLFVHSMSFCTSWLEARRRRWLHSVSWASIPVRAC